MTCNPESIPLWPERSLESVNDQDLLDENGWYRDVSIPRIVPFLPSADDANGACILICPGGSYRILDWVAHVERLAALFNPKGYAVIGLKYRTATPNTGIPELALQDLRRGLSLLNIHAAAWNIDVNRIIGLGYSAGSNLLLNHACTPLPESAESGLCGMALMCLWPNAKSADAYPVSPIVPKVFLCTTEEDATGPADFSQAIAEKMQKAGVHVSTKIFPKGDHCAFNFRENGPEVDWTPSFFAWLEGEIWTYNP